MGKQTPIAKDTFQHGAVAEKVERAEARASAYKMHVGGGLYVKVMPNGSKYWRFKYRFDGKEKILAVGVYPKVSCDAAFAARDDAKRQLDRGIDPSESRGHLNSADNVLQSSAVILANSSGSGLPKRMVRLMLTNKAIEGLKPGAKTYRVFDGGGLYLEVNPQGGRYWRLKYQFGGKEKRLALGVYPRISLAQAREKRETAKKQLADQIDPGAAKREKKAKAFLEAATTFELVAREWHEQQRSGWSSGHARDVLHVLETDVFPHIGRRAITQLGAPDILACLRKIEARGAGHIARRGRQVCSQVCRYAVVTGRAERNPAIDLQGALKPLKRRHFAALGPDELPTFLRTLKEHDERLHPYTCNSLRVLLLTFVRTMELIEAKWTEIDFDNAQWCIPAERMKMRRQHLVPLSRQALTALREQKELVGKCEWLFPNRLSMRDHMSNGAILMALKRMGYRGRMTGHGFRALAMSTIKEKLGYRHEVVDRQLAHVPANKVDAAYDRAAFLDERRRMMQEWADFIDRLQSEKHGARAVATSRTISRDDYRPAQV